MGLLPGLVRFPRRRNRYSLQYSSLENNMEKAGWQATVHGITKSQTWLRDFHFNIHPSFNVNKINMLVCVCVCPWSHTRGKLQHHNWNKQDNYHSPPMEIGKQRISFRNMNWKQNITLLPSESIIHPQFSSVHLLSHVQLFATPWIPAHQASLSIRNSQSPEFTQTHVHRVSNAIQLSHPLSSPSPPAPNPSQHQGLFKWVSSSHEVAKVWEFQPQHQSFQWTPRTDLL